MLLDSLEGLAGALPKGDPRHVLVVDGDFLAGLGLRSMLEELGHEVIVAHTPEAARDILARRPEIDLVLTSDGLRTRGEALCTNIGDVAVVCGTNRRPTCEGRDCVMVAKPFSVQAVACVLKREALYRSVARTLAAEGDRRRRRGARGKDTGATT